MNNIYNILNKNEIENKLKNFKVGQDYSISPTDEPNIKTYNFHNDKLRSMFLDDKVPVRITQETYEGKDYSYRGHFEEGQDYRYSARQWHYGDNSQENRRTNIFPNSPSFRDFFNDIKKNGGSWKMVSESGNIFTGQKYWEEELVYQGKGNENNKPWERDEVEKHQKWLAEFQEKKHFWEGRLIEERDYPKSCCEEHLKNWINSPKRQELIESIKRSIDEFETKIQHERDWLAKNYNSSQPRKIDNNYSAALEKENYELRQQLVAVQKQLVEVSEELKKLKNNSVGKDAEKLTQQIVENERLIEEGENISVSKVQEQVNKSQELMNELNVSNQDNKENSLFPYVIAASVLVASLAIISWLLVKKNKRK